MIKSDSNRNAITLMTGATLGQAIPIAVTPVLTRIYTPDDFGLFALFVAITSVLGAVACGKYELAIMLPETEEDATNIAFLAFIVNTFISLITLVCVLFFHDRLLNIFDNKEISPWLYVMPLSIFLFGAYNTFNYLSTRRKNYKKIANVNITKSGVLSLFQVAFGFFKTGGGLILGQILSQFFSVLHFLKGYKKTTATGERTLISKNRIKSLAIRYQNFPKFTLWAGLANTSATQITNILVSATYGLATLGYYSLVQRLLGAPSVLIGGAFGQVLFQEASKEKQTEGTTHKTFFSSFKKLLLVAVPVFSVLYFTVVPLFALYLGEDWIIAGVYAKTLLPLFFVFFVVSPLTALNQVNLKNKMDMIWQFGLLALYIAVLKVSEHMGFDVVGMLELMVVVISFYYLLLLYLIYRHVRNYE